MIKITGLILIFLASVMTGLFLSGKLNEKIKFLMSIKTLFYYFKREISYQAPSLKELFSENSDCLTVELTKMIAEKLDSGMSMEDSVNFSFENAECVKLLGRDEERDLRRIFSEIGKGDFESQISILENAVEKTDIFIDNAIEEKNKKSKVCLASSIYAGLAAVIIFI